MNKKHVASKILLFASMILCMIGLAACKEEVKYNAVFTDEDGTVLGTVSFRDGETPLYFGANPAKDSTPQYAFEFAGWDKELTPIKEDTVFVAQYTPQVRSYQVEWRDDDGTVLGIETAEYGSLPQEEPEITAEIDHQYATMFVGWTPEVKPVTGDVVYTATYKTEMSFPSVRIQVDGALSKEYATCTVSTCSEDSKYNLNEVSAQVKVRGNSTSTLPKLPYRIKFDKKQQMFGLNEGLKAKSWVLLAEYSDRTMLKNATAFYLAQQIMGSDGYYVSDYTFVEVYINDVYQGLYLLAEQQQVNSGRVDVDEPDQEDPSVYTGYLIEMDQFALAEDAYFLLTYPELKYFNSNDCAVAPQEGYTVKSDVYTAEQLEFIQKKIQSVFDVLYDIAYTDRSAGTMPYLTVNAEGDVVPDETIKTAYEAAERVIDVRSLINMWILSEICEDNDVGWSSFYISVDYSATGSGKLVFEAPWDFDLAFGNAGYVLNGYFSVVYNTWRENEWELGRDNPWLLVLCNQSWYIELAAERWREINANGSVIQGAIDQIDAYYEQGKTAFERNFERWGDVFTFVFPCYTSTEYEQATNWEEAIAWLKAFLGYREVFLNYVFRG